MPGRPQRRIPLTARIKDGRVYQKSTTSRRGIIYLRCQQSTVCQGTAKITNGEIQVMNPHSEYCVRDDRVESVAQFKQALKDALCNHWYRLKDLYDSFAVVYPGAAEVTPYQSIRSFMKKCRKNSYPPVPQDIQQFVDRLQDQQFHRNLEYDTGRLTVSLIADGGGNNHAALYDANFVQTEMREVTKLFVDGTFRSTPAMNDAYQLVTVMGIKFNHGIPFIWVVMSRKTEAAYSAVFEHIREHVIPHNRIQIAMTDFEPALRNSIRETFPEVNCTGCNTHHDRALYQKAKSFGLKDVIKRDDNAKTFFKKILALAYLPAHLIEQQFMKLRDEVAVDVKIRFRRFLAYYERYWLRIVGPSGYSVYGLGRRTNNILESYNSRLGHKLQAHPSAWDFVCKLLKLQADAKADVRRLRNNCQIHRHARYATVFKQRQLIKAWRELHMLSITVDEFMEKAASLKGDVGHILNRDLNGRIGRDFELQAPPIIIPLEDDPDYERELFADDPPHWLIDNVAAPVAPLLPDNDIHDNEDVNDGTSAGSDDESDEQDPLDGFEHRLSPRVEAEYNGGQRSPRLNVIEQEIQPPDDIEIINRFERQILPPNIIDQDNNPPATEEVSNIDERQTPPLDVIEEDIELLNNNGQQNPLANITARRSRNRQKKRTAEERQPVMPAEAASIKNQLRNKRRREMRQKVLARRQAEVEAEQQALRTEAEQLRVQLQQAQVQLEETAEAQLQARENGSNKPKCVICMIRTPTHAFLPCGHKCCCEECSIRLYVDHSLRTCPFCRARVDRSPVRIFQ